MCKRRTNPPIYRSDVSCLGPKRRGQRVPTRSLRRVTLFDLTGINIIIIIIILRGIYGLVLQVDSMTFSISTWTKAVQVDESCPGGRKLSRWTKAVQVDESCPGGRSLYPPGRKLSRWTKAVQVDESCPGGRKLSRWTKAVQVDVLSIHLDESCRRPTSAL
jgi:hypothetical protein